MKTSKFFHVKERRANELGSMEMEKLLYKLEGNVTKLQKSQPVFFFIGRLTSADDLRRLRS